MYVQTAISDDGLDTLVIFSYVSDAGAVFPVCGVRLLSIQDQEMGMIELYAPESTTVSVLIAIVTPGSTNDADTLVAVVPVSSVNVTLKFVKKLTEPVAGVTILG